MYVVVLVAVVALEPQITITEVEPTANVVEDSSNHEVNVHLRTKEI